MNRASGQINSPGDIEYLKKLIDTEIHQDTLKDFFAHTEISKPRFHPSDKLNVYVNKFREMLEPLKKFPEEIVSSTVGRYVFNVFMNDHTNPIFFKYAGYVNQQIDQKDLGRILEDFSNKLLVDEITSEQYIDIFNRLEWIGYNTSSYMTPGFPSIAIETNKAVQKRREELIKKHEKELNDPEKAIFKVLEIEKELLEFAKTQFKDDPEALDIYKSKTRGSFDNNYKNMSIMRGAILKYDDPTKFKISMRGLDEGIPEEDIEFYNDIFVMGTAGRALGTQKGGYLAKQLAAAFQNVVLDEEGSDCKSTGTVKLLIDRPGDFYLRYMVKDGKTTLLTPDLANKLKGTMVNLRSPMFCKSPLICNKCAGDLYYKLGITAPGLTFSNIGSSILNLSMKLFHDMTIKSVEIEIDKYIR